MIARLLSTARSAVYFWVLAHVEGRHARKVHAYNATHHGALTTRTTPRQPRTATFTGSGHTDTTGTTEGAETT